MAGWWFVVAYGYFSKAALGLNGEVLSFSRFLLFLSLPMLRFVAGYGLCDQAG